MYWPMGYDRPNKTESPDSSQYTIYKQEMLVVNIKLTIKSEEKEVRTMEEEEASSTTSSFTIPLPKVVPSAELSARVQETLDKLDKKEAEEKRCREALEEKRWREWRRAGCTKSSNGEKSPLFATWADSCLTPFLQVILLLELLLLLLLLERLRNPTPARVETAKMRVSNRTVISTTVISSLNPHPRNYYAYICS